MEFLYCKSIFEVIHGSDEHIITLAFSVEKFEFLINFKTQPQVKIMTFSIH